MQRTLTTLSTKRSSCPNHNLRRSSFQMHLSKKSNETGWRSASRRLFSKSTNPWALWSSPILKGKRSLFLLRKKRTKSLPSSRCWFKRPIRRNKTKWWILLRVQLFLKNRTKVKKLPADPKAQHQMLKRSSLQIRANIPPSELVTLSSFRNRNKHPPLNIPNEITWQNKKSLPKVKLPLWTPKTMLKKSSNRPNLRRLRQRRWRR